MRDGSQIRKAGWAGLVTILRADVYKSAQEAAVACKRVTSACIARFVDWWRRLPSRVGP